MSAQVHQLPLSRDQRAIAELYVSLLEGIPGPISVWVVNEDGLLHFYTLVPVGRDNLRAVFRAEYELMGRTDPYRLDFDVSENPEIARMVFANQPSFYHR